MGKRFIHTEDPSDMADLFSVLCTELFDVENVKGRRLLLGFSGNETAVKSKTITVDNIISLCKQNGLKFEFHLKVNYISPFFNDEEHGSASGLSPISNSGLYITPEAEEMQEQKNILKDDLSLLGDKGLGSSEGIPDFP